MTGRACKSEMKQRPYGDSYVLLDAVLSPRGFTEKAGGVVQRGGARGGTENGWGNQSPIGATQNNFPYCL